MVEGEPRLSHVVAVFKHDGKTHATVAWFGKYKQWWHYEVIRSMDAYYTKVWRDGQPRPEFRS